PGLRGEDRGARTPRAAAATTANVNCVGGWSESTGLPDVGSHAPSVEPQPQGYSVLDFRLVLPGTSTPSPLAGEGGDGGERIEEGQSLPEIALGLRRF